MTADVTAKIWILGAWCAATFAAGLSLGYAIGRIVGRLRCNDRDIGRRAAELAAKNRAGCSRAHGL